MVKQDRVQLDCRSIAYGSAEYRMAVTLRDDVLRKPLGLRLTQEQLRAEGADHHLGCFADGQMVACLILTPEPGGTVRMRQVAVAAARQRQGIGTALVRYAERFAAEHGYGRITAHARLAALSFYAKLGYQAEGERFFEVGLPHVTVLKRL